MSKWKRPDNDPKKPVRLNEMDVDTRYELARDLAAKLAHDFAGQIVGTVKEHGGDPVDGMVVTLRASHNLLLTAVAMQVEYGMSDFNAARELTLKVLREWTKDIEKLQSPPEDTPIPPKVAAVLRQLGIDPATARIMLDDNGSFLVSADVPRPKH